MTDREWLDSLKPGDTVAAGCANYGYRLEAVGRLTSTQILVGNGRYRRKDGYAVGGTPWSTAHICKPDEPYVLRSLEEQKRASLRHAIEATLRKATTAALEAALVTLNASIDSTKAVSP